MCWSAKENNRIPTRLRGVRSRMANSRFPGSCRCLTFKGLLSRPRRCPGLLWPTGSGSWVPAGRCPTGHPELSGKGWKNCPDLCHSATWSVPSSLLWTTAATPGRERRWTIRPPFHKIPDILSLWKNSLTTWGSKEQELIYPFKTFDYQSLIHKSEESFDLTLTYTQLHIIWFWETVFCM